MDIKNLKKISKAVNIGTKEYYDYIVRKCVQTIEEIPNSVICNEIESLIRSSAEYFYEKGESPYLPEENIIFGFIFKKNSNGTYKLILDAQSDATLCSEIQILNMVPGVRQVSIGFDSICEITLEFNLNKISWDETDNLLEEMEEYMREIFGCDFEEVDIDGVLYRLKFESSEIKNLLS